MTGVYDDMTNGGGTERPGCVQPNAGDDGEVRAQKESKQCISEA